MNGSNHEIVPLLQDTGESDEVVAPLSPGFRDAYKRKRSKKRELQVSFAPGDDTHYTNASARTPQTFFRKGSGNFTPGIQNDLAAISGKHLVSSPRSSRKQYKRPLSENRVRLTEIRHQEMAQDAEDNPALKLPQTMPTFESNAHLRSDAYWEELLGRKDPNYPFEWIRSGYFQFICCCAILTNVILLNIDEGGHDWHELATQSALWFSVLEFALHLYRAFVGVPFPTTESIVFFILELLAVVVCWVDLFLLPALGLTTAQLEKNGLADLSPMLRMTWLLRLVRFIQLVPQLHELFHGVMDALQGLFWVLVFMCLLIYAVSILCARLIGHYDLDNELSEAKLVQRDFENVMQSMFTLFMIMSSWSLQPLVPAMLNNGYCRGSFIVFYVFAGWTLLAVMTGTVSFHMMMSKAQVTTDDEQMESMKKARLTTMFNQIFKELDEDGNGSLCYEEFQMMLQSKELLRLLASDTNINPKDLEDMWEWLDEDGQDCVMTDDFMDAFMFLNEPLSSKSVLKMKEKIRTDTDIMKGRMNRSVEATFNKLAGSMADSIVKLAPTTEQALILNGCISLLCEKMGVPPGGYTKGPPQELEVPRSPRVKSARAERARSARALADSYSEEQPDEGIAAMLGGGAEGATVMAQLRNRKSRLIAQQRAAIKAQDHVAFENENKLNKMEKNLSMQIRLIESRIDKFMVKDPDMPSQRRISTFSFV